MRPDLAEALETVRELSRALQDKADDLAAEHQARLERFEHSPDPCLITDDAGRILAANRACTELLDLPAHRLIRRRIAWVLRQRRDRVVAKATALGAERCWRLRLR